MKQYKYRVNGKNYDVAIDEINGKNAKVTVNGISYDVEIEGEAGEGLAPLSGIDAISAGASAAPAKPVAAPKAAESKPAAAPKASAAPGKGTPVKAPLPGDAGKKGQTVVVLEAMKMQNNINAESDGTITSVTVTKGDTVNEGATLVTIG